MSNTRAPRARAAATNAARKQPLKPNGLNLDTLQREGEPPEPYTSVVGGRLYTFADPAEMEWLDAAAMGPNDIVRFIRGLLDEKDWEEFRQIRLKLWKVAELAKDIQRHYGVLPEDEGKDAEPAG